MEEYMYSKTSRDDDCFTGKIGNSGLEAESGSCRSLRLSPTPRGRGGSSDPGRARRGKESHCSSE